MKSPKEIISDEEILMHHYGNFGENADPRHIVNLGVLTAAFGYSQGSTVKTILYRHKLITKNSPQRLSKKGFIYLRSIFRHMSMSEILSLTKAPE